MANEIRILTDSYVDDQISEARAFMAQDIIGDELQYNTFEATISPIGIESTKFIPKGSTGMLTFDKKVFKVLPFVSVIVGDPSAYKYGAETLVYHKGNLLGRFYMTDITRINNNMYNIKCISGIGLLANSQHYGGVYGLDRKIKAPELIREIVGSVTPITISAEFDKVSIYGWLPVGTRRDNLHHVLFAIGAVAIMDKDGNPFITPLSDETKTALEDNRFFVGGKVKFPESGVDVSVIEHTYVKGALDKKVILFEGDIPDEQIVTPNGKSVNGGLVIFKEPAHGPLTISKGSILESGDNYAVLSPALGCKLEGYGYTHTLREVRKTSTTARGLEQEKNHITVKDETLVSFANVENVADRILAYFSAAKIVTSDIEVREEKPGEAVQFNTPFKNQLDGFMTSMDINISNKLKAGCKIVANYTPPNPGNVYNNVEVLTTNKDWIVPTDTKKVRLVLIGGGQGGYNGHNGETGTEQWLSSPNYEDGKGGKGGIGGSGGKIYIISISVTPGQKLSFSIGDGGLGAPASDISNPGSDGYATKMGPYSSELGTSSVSGYTELISGQTYALGGGTGISGGRGRNRKYNGENVSYLGKTYYPGSDGSDISHRPYGTATGGFGGGPAAGMNGGNGSDADYNVSTIHGIVGVLGGAGGQGANAIPPNAPIIPGNGGNGGNGGGGGGGGGFATNPTQTSGGGSGGKGGIGSQGSNGAKGCAIIYY